MNRELKNKIVTCRLCDSLAVNYHKEREENLNYAYSYLPDRVKVLWIVESPPLAFPPRYFYRPELTKYDSLFRETMKVLDIPITHPKTASLKSFSDKGYFLIDSMKCPADKNNSHLKPKIRLNCSSILKKEIIQIDPLNILIIKADVYNPVMNLLCEIDQEYPDLKISSRVLNKGSIPFPGSGQQKRFRELVTEYINNIE